MVRSMRLKGAGSNQGQCCVENKITTGDSLLLLLLFVVQQQKGQESACMSEQGHSLSSVSKCGEHEPSEL